MNNRPYDSLSSSLVLPFVLLGFVVSALLSLVTFGLVADLEERAITRMLRMEMESFQNRKARNPAALPPSAALLAGHILPVPDFPHLDPAKPGQERIERILHDDRDYSVMITAIGGTPYALIYDRTYVATSLGNLALFLLVGTGVMTLLSFLVGNHLAGQVVRPIGKLLGEISEKAAKNYLRDGPPLTFSAAEYPNNEIGRLVQGLDQFALRLSGFLERESHFAADVSHELRTPVAIIRGATEVLVEYPDLPDAFRQRLGTIHRQSVRMGQILEAMLLLAREETERGDPACAIAEVIDDAVADCTPSLAGRPVTIAVNVRERTILAVERSLAYVVISNLLRNACSCTREGVIEIYLDGKHLEIADSGIGIPEERFPELFKRHAKGDESSGHGLGLSIVARVAQRLDWTVEIQSRHGIGTRVSITFTGAGSDLSPKARPTPRCDEGGKGSRKKRRWHGN